MNITKCPYCGKTVSYFGTIATRRNGEYFCNKCKKESNVVIKKTVLLFYPAALALSLLALAYFLLLTDRENLWFMLIVAIPFFIFYLFVPMFVRLTPKKKFQDSLYDTEMVDTPIADPDPTMAKTAKVVPAFVDDVVLGDDEYRPSINSDVFNAIKEERKAVAETDGGTRHFDRFDNISSEGDFGHTKTVQSIRHIPVADNSAESSVDRLIAELENEGSVKERMSDILDRYDLS